MQVEGLSFSYGDHQVLHNVSFEARPGEMMAVLGPNGAGKSTLFRCMLGILPGYTGRVLLEGRGVEDHSAVQRARKIAYVPQSHYPTFNFTVLDMALMGTTAHVNSISSPGPEQVKLAKASLERLGISHLEKRGFRQISGGERQLALIGRALAQQAHILLMDEPTANLDYGNQLRVLTQVRQLAAEGYMVIQSTHSPDHAFLFADSVLAIQSGRVAACGPPRQVLTGELISSLYGVEVEVYRNENGYYSCMPRLPWGAMVPPAPQPTTYGGVL